jgi:hypothetical protein
VKDRIEGNGSLIIKDSGSSKQRRIRRGMWHKSDFAPSGQINMKDLVSIVDKVPSRHGLPDIALIPYFFASLFFPSLALSLVHSFTLLTPSRLP